MSPTNRDGGFRRARQPALCGPAALLVWITLTAGCSTLPRQHIPEPGTDEARVMVGETSEQTLAPVQMHAPQRQRWRDIAGVPYAEALRADFDYADADRRRVEVRYHSPAPTLQGAVRACGLKPWFAYQLKLVGAKPISGALEEDNAQDARTWSSWQLGHLGRWWCEDCRWNVPDAELARHLEAGHSVRGYLLFDWFVTDGHGGAEHQFALDSSLHVLWRVGQRERGYRDGPPRWYELRRLAYGYEATEAGAIESIGLFGEWEPDRPGVGSLRLPPGEYICRLNVTEESFHDNMDEGRTLEGGGFWAWVLDAALRFEVR